MSLQPKLIYVSFDGKTSSATIATPGDETASRWVKLRHYNPYSGQKIVKLIQIFFNKSLSFLLCEE